MNEEKHRRMEIRKSTGSRCIQPPPPAHKGPVYAMSFACFSCQKSFKRHVEASPKDYPNHMSCPECGGVSVNLGRNFKAPKKNDVKQWEKVRFLVDHGFLFQKIRVGANHHDTVPYPETLEEAREFVKTYKEYTTAPKIS